MIFERSPGDETIYGPPEYETMDDGVKLKQLLKTYELSYWKDFKSRVEREADEENES